jgi:hypothetical protein
MIKNDELVKRRVLMTIEREIWEGSELVLHWGCNII